MHSIVLRALVDPRYDPFDLIFVQLLRWGHGRADAPVEHLHEQAVVPLARDHQLRLIGHETCVRGRGEIGRSGSLMTTKAFLRPQRLDVPAVTDVGFRKNDNTCRQFVLAGAAQDDEQQDKK